MYQIAFTAGLREAADFTNVILLRDYFLISSLDHLVTDLISCSTRATPHVVCVDKFVLWPCVILRPARKSPSTMPCAIPHQAHSTSTALAAGPGAGNGVYPAHCKVLFNVVSQASLLHFCADQKGWAKTIGSGRSCGAGIRATSPRTCNVRSIAFVQSRKLSRPARQSRSDLIFF